MNFFEHLEPFTFRFTNGLTKVDNGRVNTDKHDYGTIHENGGHPPHLFYPPRVPRREIDWERVGMRWMAGRSDNETRLYRFFLGIGDFLSRLKRRQPKTLVNQLVEDPGHWDRAIDYTHAHVTTACSKRPDTDGTTGGKSFRDRQSD